VTRGRKLISGGPRAIPSARSDEGSSFHADGIRSLRDQWRASMMRASSAVASLRAGGRPRRCDVRHFWPGPWDRLFVRTVSGLPHPPHNGGPSRRNRSVSRTSGFAARHKTACEAACRAPIDGGTRFMNRLPFNAILQQHIDSKFARNCHAGQTRLHTTVCESPAKRAFCLALLASPKERNRATSYKRRD
jgi:hypothetical protein